MKSDEYKIKQNMENFPPEIIWTILFHMEPYVRFHASQVSVEWSNLSSSFVFPITNRKELKRACLTGDILSIKEAYSEKNTWWNNHEAFGWACQSAFYPLISFFINRNIEENGKALLHGIFGAGRSGDDTLFNKIMVLCLNRFKSLEIFTICQDMFYGIIALGFEGACRGGHLKLCKELYIKGDNKWNWNNASKNIPIFTVGGNNGFIRACRGNHLEIINFLLSKGANDGQGGINAACKGGHLDLTKYLRKIFPFPLCSLKPAFPFACRSGNMTLVLWIMHKTRVNVNFGLRGAVMGGHETLIDFLLEKGADDYSNAFLEACSGGHLKLAQKFYRETCDLNLALSKAKNYGHQNIVLWLEELGATNKAKTCFIQ